MTKKRPRGTLAESVVAELLQRVRAPRPVGATASRGRPLRAPPPLLASSRDRETIVLGIDPGTIRCGWGILSKQGRRIAHVAHGIVRLDDKAPLGERLVVLERELERVIALHRPGQASVESIFFSKDAQAAAKLGHARGVVMLVCARNALPIHEYPPARVKLTVTGSGRAEKTQIARMMMTLLALPELPRADAADALAIALTDLQRGP